MRLPLPGRVSAWKSSKALPTGWHGSCLLCGALLQAATRCNAAQWLLTGQHASYQGVHQGVNLFVQQLKGSTAEGCRGVIVPRPRPPHTHHHHHYHHAPQIHTAAHALQLPRKPAVPRWFAWRNPGGEGGGAQVSACVQQGCRQTCGFGATASSTALRRWRFDSLSLDSPFVFASCCVLAGALPNSSLRVSLLAGPRYVLSSNAQPPPRRRAKHSLIVYHLACSRGRKNGRRCVTSMPC